MTPSGKGEAYSYKRSNWFDAVREEALAVRERVGLMDLSTFSKFDVKGKDAYAFLERICANKIPTRMGALFLAISSTKMVSSNPKSRSRV